MAAIVSTAPYAGDSIFPPGILLITSDPLDVSPGDVIEINGHSGSDPDINGQRFHVIVSGIENSYLLNGTITTGGTGGTATQVTFPSVVVPMKLKTGNTIELDNYTGGYLNGGTSAEPVWDHQKKQLRIFTGENEGGHIIGFDTFTADIATSTVGGATDKAIEFRVSPGVSGRVDYVFVSANSSAFYLNQLGKAGTGLGGRRGDGAVDFQTLRSLDTEVASGARSMILAGQQNRASGNHSVAMGHGAAALRQNQFAIGGGIPGGAAQRSVIVAPVNTTSATPGTLNIPVNGVEDPVNRTWMADIRIVARAAGGADVACYHRRCLVSNNAGSVAIEGAVQTIGTDVKSSGASAWDVDVDVNGTSLRVTVTGAASTTIRWVVTLDLVEVGLG